MHLIPPEWRSSQNPALFEKGVWLTYAALSHQIERRAEQLSRPRSLAFCFCRIDTATVINYLACLLAGHPILLLDANLHPEARLSLLNHYRPELLLASEDLPGLPPSYRVSSTNSAPYFIWESRSSDSSEIHPDLTLLLSTSGTTGSPKLVRLSERNIISNTHSISSGLSIQPSSRAMASLPFHYSYGLSVLHSHLCSGASLALSSKPILSSGFWDACRENHANSLAGVPYTYQLLYRLQLENLNVPQLTTLTQAGGKLASQLISHFHALMQRRNGRFFIMYGQTEATARIAILPSDSPPEKLSSVGLPVPGGAFHVQDSGGAIVSEPDVPGEVVYSGPNVMLGYAMCRADLARGDDMQGRLPTGDLGHIDKDGYLYISCRLKREAKIAGHRINLDEVETLLKLHGPTAAVAGPDKIMIFCEWGDAAVHSIALRELAERLHFSLHAFHMHRLPALPVTASGKIDYASLAALL